MSAVLNLLLLLVLGGDTIASSDIEKLFRGHKVDGNYAVALKKRGVGGVAYLATVHGYPNNLSVCEELIAPYNKDASLSALPSSMGCTAACIAIHLRINIDSAIPNWGYESLFTSCFLHSQCFITPKIYIL